MIPFATTSTGSVLVILGIALVLVAFALVSKLRERRLPTAAPLPRTVEPFDLKSEIRAYRVERDKREWTESRFGGGVG